MKKTNHTYVNVGLDRVLPANDIIGIFDVDSISIQKDSRTFLNKAEKRGQVENIATDLPISFILCGKKEQKLILTSFSLPTLYGRMKRKFP